MLVICSELVRFSPDIYRTYTGQVPEKNGRCSIAVCLLHWVSLLDMLEFFSTPAGQQGELQYAIEHRRLDDGRQHIKNI